MEQTIKAAFIDAMRILKPGTNRISMAAHRDLIRNYVMGWLDALRHAGTGGYMETGDFFEAIAKENWWPNRSWCWWNNEG